MARVRHAAEHQSIEEVKHRQKTHPRPWSPQRWLIIYNALIEPRKAEEIARPCGLSQGRVHQVISTYNRFGVQAVETPGKGGRRHESLSLEEEKQWLAPFLVRAQAGEIATAGEVQLAFEARIGHEVDESTMYRFLKRHRWRKLMPRPNHPQASIQQQEHFKNTLQGRFRRQLPHGKQKRSDRSS